MGTILAEFLINTVLPSGVLLGALLIRRGFLRGAHLLDPCAFALCFVVGQSRILGEFPWPPQETSHIFVYFAAISPVGEVAASRSKIWPSLSYLLILLNIGLYYGLYPLSNDFFLVALQWLATQGAAVALFVAMRWLSTPFELVPSIVLLVVLGPTFLASGSTSLAMTTLLLAGLASVVGMVRPWSVGAPPEMRPLLAAAPTLLALELYNYVL